jgi:Prolipoprotein diacylglyceryl transferase
MNMILDGEERIDEQSQRKTGSTAFQLCGYTGFFLAFVQSLLLVRYLGFSQLTLLGMTGTVILTFYVLMMVTKILAGHEVIIYYHHEIAVIVTSALFLRLTNQPILPYLDVLVLGLGLFLSCGRVGCLLVGCCHGRPWRVGVRYGDDHADAGFPRHLVRVKLFPIQGLESIMALTIVAFGLLLLGEHQPGSVMSLYVTAYGCGRFCLEFFRGDGPRPYYWGFSEAQWISAILAALVAIGERVRILPSSQWHTLAAICLGMSMVLLSIWRRLDRSCRFELSRPDHLGELMNALRQLGTRSHAGHELNLPPTIQVAETSRGYRISMGESIGTSGPIKHCSVSKSDGLLTRRTAQQLARLIANAAQDSASFKLIEGSSGVFHILLNRNTRAAPSLLVEHH